MSDWRANTRTFYGWWLVAAMFIILFNTGGMGFYVFPVFIESFKAEFGWNMTQISGSGAVWAIVFGFSGPLIGVLISRFGARKTMLAAAALASLTNLGFASMNKLWHLYAINLVAGFVVAGTTLVPAQTLVTNWFDKYRGRAMALVMVGIGAGGALLPYFNEWLIRTIKWRMTWVVACIILWAVLIPIIAIFVRTRPSDIGLVPDGLDPDSGEAKNSSHQISGLPVKTAVTTTTFWLIFGIFVFQLMGVSAMNFHFVPFATLEIKFTNQQAALFYGLTVGSSIIGRLLFGWLADRYKPHLLTAMAGSLLSIGPAMLWLFFIKLGLRDPYLLLLHAVPFGIGIGGNSIVLPVLVGRCFGELNFSKIMGLVMSGFAIGIIVGLPVAGKIFDNTGSYALAFILCFIVLMTSAAIAIPIRPHKYHSDFVSEEAS